MTKACHMTTCHMTNFSSGLCITVYLVSLSVHLKTWHTMKKKIHESSSKHGVIKVYILGLNTECNIHHYQGLVSTTVTEIWLVLHFSIDH